VPIVSADYERPVSLSFGEGAQILTAEVAETDPDSIQTSVNIGKSVTGASSIVLEPVLLNGGDSITLKLLVSQLGEIGVNGRIVGVKDIRKLAARRVGFWPIINVLSILATVFEVLLMIVVVLYALTVLFKYLLPGR
jgi:hypothetical protein